MKQMWVTMLEGGELHNEKGMILRHRYVPPAQRQRENYAANEKRAA
jgi:hypothetical protein